MYKSVFIFFIASFPWIYTIYSVYLIWTFFWVLLRVNILPLLFQEFKMTKASLPSGSHLDFLEWVCPHPFSPVLGLKLSVLPIMLFSFRFNSFVKSYNLLLCFSLLMSTFKIMFAPLNTAFVIWIDVEILYLFSQSMFFLICVV